MAERSGVVTFKGNPLTLVGDEGLKVGQKAPDVRLSKSLLEDIKISDLKGKAVILSIVPSLDTGVCSTQTAKFNAEAKALGDKVTVVTVSLDLPPAQARWCQANAAENIKTVSDYKHREFACASGLLIKELGLLARAVYVLDKDGVVKYGQIVPEMTTEPDYEKALSVAKGL
jgi:thiol peroxidase